ncbi:MAG: tetratricopeptide repeat protein [Alphaproteobacteria bacterium]
MKVRNGTITGTGIDTYSYTAQGGVSFVVIVSETGSHTEDFIPALTLKDPNGKTVESGAQKFFYRSQNGIQPFPGKWTAEVSRKDGGDKGGSYEIKLLEVPNVHAGMDPNMGGMPLQAGQFYTGTLARGAVDVYTFIWMGGETVHLSLEGDNTDFTPEVTHFGPSGEVLANCSHKASCTLDTKVFAGGGHTVAVARKDAHDGAGTYKLGFDLIMPGEQPGRPTAAASKARVKKPMGPLENGKPLSGTIKGGAIDTYAFKVAKGTAFVATLSLKGAPIPGFKPQLSITGPPGSMDQGGGMGELFTKKSDTEPVPGDWTIEVSQMDENQPGGEYVLRLFQAPGVKGTPMKLGQTYKGSVARGEIAVYTVSGTPGVLVRLGLNVPDNKEISHDFTVIGPDGKLLAGGGCSGEMKRCYSDFKMEDYGDYTVLLGRYDQNDVKGPYSVSVARTDGKIEVPALTDEIILRNTENVVMPETVRVLDRRMGFYMWNMFLTYGLDDFGLRDDKEGKATLQLAIGDRQARDPKWSLPYWQKAAEMGNADAVNRLGMVYSKYHDDKKYETAAWYLRILEQGKEDEDVTKANGALTGNGGALDFAVAKKLYQEAADKGNAVAQFNLGVLLELGIDKKSDHTAAAMLYAKAADQGLSVAQYNLAELFAQGQGVKRDDAAAAKLYLKASEIGYPPALFRLAEMALIGRGMQADAVKAKAWLKQAAEGGHAEAKIELDMLEGRTAEAGQSLKKSAAAGDAAGLRRMVELYRKTGISKADYDDVLEIYRSAAGKVNPQAFAGLADLFAKQEPPDYFEAFFWHLLVLDSVASIPLPPDEKAELVKYATEEAGRIVKKLSPEQAAVAKWRVDDRHPRAPDAAQKAGAELFLRGNKAYVEERYEDAAIFFLQAAKMGSARSDHALGNMFMGGCCGLPRDIDKAIAHYKKSVRGGFVGGASEIGFLYLYGIGVPQNQATAMQWYEIDASRGHKPAVDLLGLIYLSTVEGKKAIALYEKAAARDVDEANAALGMIYLYGTGVPVDTKKALKWYLRSAEKGLPTGAIQAGYILKDYEPRDYAASYRLLLRTGITPVVYNNKAFMIENQLGVKENKLRGYTGPEPTAMEVYKKAADMCYGRAMYNIGRLHDTGTTSPFISAQPIKKDPAVARKWMEMAARYGSIAAAAWLNARDPESPKVIKVPPVETGLDPKPCKAEGQ